jgi:hypothetical protein
MSRCSLLLAAFAFALSCAARAAVPEAAGLVSAREALQDAANHADAAAIARARAAFVALQADALDSPAIAYGIALCCWRAEPIVLRTDRDAARKLCKDGIAACDRAFALDPRFADALALKGTLQGMAITFVPDARIALAGEMNENLARAASLEPKNPRVALLTGLTTLHKPQDLGGGAARALPQLDRALELFAASGAPARNGITWGRDDALLWSGIARSRTGDWAGARSRFKAALETNPENVWVREALLPEAERHLAAPADSAR